MSSCITLKEAQLLVRKAATSLAPLVKDSLELWLQAAEDLPCHIQHPCVATATSLVQSAIQQAPWRQRDCQHKQLAWLQKHLPAVSTAMHDCVINQSGISNKRISILQSLVGDSQQQGNTQLLAKAEAERDSFLLLSILACAYLLVCSVTAMCDGLSWSSTSGPWVGNSLREQAYEHQQHRLQQGNRMIREVMLSIARMGKIKIHLEREMDTLDLQLKELGVPAFGGPEELWRSIAHMRQLQCHANVVWLNFGTSLPPAHPETGLVANAVDWSVMRPYEWDEHTRAHLLPMVQEVRMRSLERFRQTIQAMCRDNAAPEVWYPMLQHMKLTSKEFKALTLSTEDEQQVFSLMHEAGVDFVPDDPQKPSSRSVGSAQEGKNEEQSASSNKEELGIAAGDNMTLDDMQALLQLMYGCSLK